MTNAEKYLKENVDIHTLSKEIISFMNGVVEDKYIGMIEDFFNCPVKPILTEDEKVVLKCLPKDVERISRDTDGELEIRLVNKNNTSDFGYDYFGWYKHLFQFIKPRRRI